MAEERDAGDVISLALSIRLAHLMVQEKLLSQNQLDQGLAAQKKTPGGKLGTALIAEGFIKEDDVLEFIARQCGLSRINLADLPAIPDEALLSVPKAMARKHMLIPFDKTPDRLSVAIADPLNVMILDDLQIMTGCEVKAALASERDILAAQEKFYRQLKKGAKAGRAKAPEPPADSGDVISLDLPRRLANTLVERGTITQAQLDEALEIRKQSQRKLGSILVARGYIEPESLLEFVAQQCGLGYINLASVTEIPEEVIALVPKNTARQHTLIPFNKTANCLMVAISDPLNVLVLDELKLMTGCEVKAVLAAAAEIKAAIDVHYRRKFEEARPDAASEDSEEDPEEDPEEAESDDSPEAWEPPTEASWEDDAETSSDASDKDRAVDYDEGEDRLGRMVEQAREMASAVGAGDVELQSGEVDVDVADVDPATPEVQKIINAVIMNALSMKASDIHIEPFEDPAGRHSRVRVRYRVDGVLRRGKLSVIPWMYRSAVITKIKLLTETMNITERRIPQTGHIHIMAKNHPVEFRVEMIPTVYGETCVMRVMDRREMLVDVNKIGFLPDMHKRFLGLLKGIGGKKNFGLILVCGPSGSGKSTTLYACLNHIKRPDIKIWTAENPVEFNIMGVVQVSVNPDIRLGEGKRFNFASSLRSFLRLDPDVIMVGEIRDEETAEIAMEAAMTGHLVFATLHTTDAPSAISRLIGMGLPGYLIADTLKAVLAQRLSRRLCPDCKEAYDPPPEDEAVFKANAVELPAGTKLYRAKGCARCMQSGYRGRVGMYELMVVGDNVREACHKDVSSSNVCQAAIKDGMRLLLQDSLEKAKSGLTSLREVLGRTGEIGGD